MSIHFHDSGGGDHDAAENHHYYRQDSAPTVSNPLQVGDLWSDTTANLVKRCTSISPVTFVSIEGGSAAHDLFSATHGDVDEADTPADNEVLTFDNAAGDWKSEAASGHGDHHDEAHLLNDHTAVAIGGATIGQIIKFSGASWVNNSLAQAGIASVTHAATHADGGADELAVQDLASDAADNGQVAKADGAGAVAFEDDSVVINFIIDGGGSVITTGVKGYVELPFGMTIEGVTMLADQSGSIVVDVWKDSYANYPPLDADSITASAVPTISTAIKSQDLTLTGWTTAVTAGDILGFNVDSVTTIQRLTIAIRGKKT